jgi:hypothetical protein
MALEETIIEESQKPTKRPDFLNVICVLSFIGSGWAAIQGFISMVASDSPEEVAAQMDEQMSQMPEDSGFLTSFVEGSADMAIAAAENAVPMGVATIVISLASLLGVFYMFKLQKKGFGIYALANLVGIAVPIIFLGAGTVVLLTVGITTLITFLFIGMYAANLKHMS